MDTTSSNPNALCLRCGSEMVDEPDTWPYCGTCGGCAACGVTHPIQLDSKRDPVNDESVPTNLQVFTPRRRESSKVPVVTTYPHGIFRLNMQAIRSLGYPDAVVLLINRETRRIGFRSVPPGTKSSVPVRGRRSQRVVSSTALLREMGILKFICRWEGQMQGDILVIDLGDPQADS